MTDKVNEILDILQEECAEVIQSVSKCRRFGLDSVYLNGMKTSLLKLWRLWARPLGRKQAIVMQKQILLPVFVLPLC